MGRAFIFGDNLDTDLIVPGQYLSLSAPEDLRKVCMDGYRPGFYREVSPGDVFVAGANFGCGSSREHAPISIKAAGVAFVIAKSFARIFYRNAINIGLPVLEAPEAVEGISPGDSVDVNLLRGQIVNETKGNIYEITPFPPAVLEILAAGGLVEYVREQKKRK
jgi:3-isopropylmalate/(R)-2-methylmalate dehydratase small subunit